MRAAILAYEYDQRNQSVRAALHWVDVLEGRPLSRFPVHVSPNPGILPRHDLALVSYGPLEDGRDVLDAHQLSDGMLRARLPMDCRAHFNVCPNWSCFVESPDENVVYVYKARTLGDHLAADYICGFDPSSMCFLPWEVRVPRCIAGWSAAGGGRARLQMLFVADGVESGRLPVDDLDQKVCFWIGVDDGFGPMVSLGPRPRSHSDLGHACALLSAAAAPLSIVVSNDGGIHLIDPVDFRLIERRWVTLPDGFAVTNFAAAVDRNARVLVLGLARDGARHEGRTETLLLYDLRTGRTEGMWALERSLVHFAMTEQGDLLVGAEADCSRLIVLNPRRGTTVASQTIEGFPQYVMVER